jgi:tetratricopeptide (TPR) repeat protein
MFRQALFLQVLLLIGAWPGAAQSPTVELRATGEYRMANGGDAETARQMALMDARRKVLHDAALRLAEAPEVKAIPFRPNQIDAFLPAIVEVEAGAARAEQALYRSEVSLRLSIAETARHLDQLRKDQGAAAGLVDIWAEAEKIHQQLAGAGGNAAEQNRLITSLKVKRIAAQVYAALAKTEESPASRRVPSEKGRERAKQLAETAIAMGPDIPEAHIAMGDVLIDADEPDAAEKEFRQAIRLGLTSAAAHYKLADALRNLDKDEEAIRELREALRVDPNSATAHTDLGYMLGTQQKTAESIAELQAAVKIDPDFIEAHNFLAIAHARAGRIPESVGEFREIVRIDPDSVLGHYNMGIALADMEKDDESAEAFRQAVRINPGHYNARYNLGELLRLEGKFDDAVRQFQEYLRLAPESPQNRRNFQRARDFIKTHENP